MNFVCAVTEILQIRLTESESSKESKENINISVSH